ncbi:bifunctional DNA primase/polymerase [Streptomyces sp. SAJ15]|uniref:bifunctional DNA primase/polymerase n=1 Tax=Streptomyces sp. SAJ15 TaxID=2011095 RepID=UPI001186E4D6|nr:DNA primase [Streptomyces sp. SAJ15]
MGIDPSPDAGRGPSLDAGAGPSPDVGTGPRSGRGPGGAPATPGRGHGPVTPIPGPGPVTPIPGPGPATPGPARAAPCHGECGRLGHGVYDASTDPDTIRALFAAAPWATGYGIACGVPPHHLVGVDLDHKPATATDGLAAFARLAREHAFAVPHTVTVLTPSGGRHLWLTAPGNAPVHNSVGRLARGVDIRGLGGYLVGPGSRSSRGDYRRAPGSPLWTPAPAPEALLRLLAPPRPVSHPRPTRPLTRHRAAALVAFVRASRPGERNSRLYWAACRACDAGADPALTHALLDAALSTGLPPHEAAATLASAARRDGLRRSSTTWSGCRRSPASPSDRWPGSP